MPQRVTGARHPWNPSLRGLYGGSLCNKYFFFFIGLNLVGANHLFLLDMHWNPQLEAQACDRIYRVGQKRNVKIHKFLCEDTVESRIQELQLKKMDLANDVLTGAKRSNANKLTLDDLKMLFGLESK